MRGRGAVGRAGSTALKGCEGGLVGGGHEAGVAHVWGGGVADLGGLGVVLLALLLKVALLFLLNAGGFLVDAHVVRSHLGGHAWLHLHVWLHWSMRDTLGVGGRDAIRSQAVDEPWHWWRPRLIHRATR